MPTGLCTSPSAMARIGLRRQIPSPQPFPASRTFAPMGILDDAIREHLELKRQHGGDPSAIDR